MSINGIKHTLQLSDEDAKRYGLNPTEPVDVVEPEEPENTAGKKQATPVNKAKTVANKSR
ncbi:hypothetical protein [Mobiluncus porci]|uniref:hypothetical protein n=1 Tax=Mobiluncus porci TaxID=2652278 RepID=UPI001E33DC5E|nr:hypothetical protein [Mobiluncus porci]